MRIRPTTLLLLVSPLILLFAAAYIQWGTAGLPPSPHLVPLRPEFTAVPHGFPAWLRIAHYVNFLFLTLLIRSGLQILMDHPRLYGNVHCTPGTEWLRLTPVEVPKDRVWTAKDDSRYLCKRQTATTFRMFVEGGILDGSDEIYRPERGLTRNFSWICGAQGSNRSSASGSFQFMLGSRSKR